MAINQPLIQIIFLKNNKLARPESFIFMNKELYEELRL